MTKWLRTHARRLMGLPRDESGPAAIVVGLALIPLMLSLGLVLDGGLLFYFDRAARNGADSAALAATRKLWADDNGDGLIDDQSTLATQVRGACNAAALSAAVGPDPTTFGDGSRPAADVACAVATSPPYGYLASQVTVNMPPDISTNFKDATKHVEVLITRPYNTLIMSIVGQDQVTIARRAVGGAIPASTTYAIYVLNPTDSSPCPTMNVGSNTDLVVSGGGIVVDSNCDGTPQSSLDVGAGAGVDVGSPGVIDVVGDCDAAPSDIDPECTDLSAPVPDPMQGEPEVVHHHTSGGGSCTYPNFPLNGDSTPPNPPYAPCSADFGDINPGILPGQDFVKDAHLAPLTGVGTPVSDARFTYKYDLYPGVLGPDGTEDDTGAFNIAGSRWLLTPRYVADYVGCLDGPGQICTSQTDPESFDVCEAPNPDLDGDQDMYPGVYWGGFERSGSSCNVEFHPGVYVIAGREGSSRASIDLQGASGLSITGNNLLFYVTEAPEASSQKRPFGPMIIHNANDGTVNLSAGSTTCPYIGPSFEGIFLFVDRRFNNGNVPYATAITGGETNRVDISGGSSSSVQIDGTFYFPTGLFIANGAVDLSNAQIITWLLNFGVSADVTVTCTPGTNAGSLLVPRLRE